MSIYNHIKSQIDFILSSLSTFFIFIFIKSLYGLDIAGFFGIIISMAALLETIQQGLYERPAFLGIPSGINNFKLDVKFIIIFSFLSSLILDRFFLSGYLLVNSFYITSFVLIQNIRTYDYVKGNLNTATIRSLNLFILKATFLALSYFKILIIEFKDLILFLTIINTLTLIFQRKKIFAIQYKGTNNSSKIFLTSLLILIKNRLPLWLLYPFGLGLIGIYETFRTLVEIYLIPAKGVLKLMLRELNYDNNKKIVLIGIIFGLLSFFVVLITFDYIVNLNIYSHNEISDSISKISLSIIVLFFWLTESLSMVLQNKKHLSFEFNRRLFSIIIFILVNLVFFNSINYQLFILNVSFIYVFEVLFAAYFYKKNYG